MARRTHFIREWRTARGLSQEALAVAMTDAAETWPVDADNPRRRWHRTDITKIERRLRDYDASMLEAAAEVLKCSPENLIADDPTKAPVIPKSEVDKFVAAISRVPTDDRARVLKLIEAFAQSDVA